MRRLTISIILMILAIIAIPLTLPRIDVAPKTIVHPSSPPVDTADVFNERIVVYDRGAPFGENNSQSSLLIIAPNIGRVEVLVPFEQLQCAECNFLLDAERATLYTMRANSAGENHRGSDKWKVYAAQIIRVDARTGALESDPVFATSGISWGWTPLGLSPDKRAIYLNIPYNPIHADEHPLHARQGIATYDLTQRQLAQTSLTSRGAMKIFASRHGERLYLCCWVQLLDHPHPGITTIGTQDSSLFNQVIVRSASLDVPLTHLTPADDDGHFYALRPNGDWWFLDANGGKIIASGSLSSAQEWYEQILVSLDASPAYAKGGEYDRAAGDVVVGQNERMYSSLYTVIEGASTLVRRHKSGGGIAVVDKRDFKRVAQIAAEATWEALALSRDGTRLYALDSDAAELRVFDAQTLQEISRVDGVGKFPTAMFVVPPR